MGSQVLTRGEPRPIHITLAMCGLCFWASRLDARDVQATSDVTTVRTVVTVDSTLADDQYIPVRLVP